MDLPHIKEGNIKEGIDLESNRDYICVLMKIYLYTYFFVLLL